MGNLASLTFRLGADIKEFQTTMRKASNMLKSTGEQMKSMGKSMSMYVTAPIVAMAGASIAAFDKQAQAENKLAAQIRANGKDVQWYMNHYKSLASGLQSVTTIGDETTLGLIQLAESMQSADAGEAAKSAVGLSKALGVDLQSALKMVVLAQNGEYTMLQRYVPSLRTASDETQKAAIVSKLYADGLSIAKTEAQTGLGPLQQLKNTIGDISEEFGGIIADAIKPLVQWLKGAMDRFQGLSTHGKKVVTIMLGVAAAIGPVLTILGTMVTLLPAIGAAFTAMLGPIGLVIAAIAAIGASFIYIYGNWEAVKERMGDWSWWKNALIQAAQWLIEYSPISLLIKSVNELISWFGGDPIPNPFESLADALEGVKADTNEYQYQFKSFGATLSDVTKEVGQNLGLFGSSAKAAVDAPIQAMREALPVIKTFETRVTDLKNVMKNKVNVLLPFDTAALERAANMAVTGVNNFEDRFTDAYNTMRDSMNQVVSQGLAEMGTIIGEGIGDLLSGVKPNFGAKVLGSIGKFLKSMGTAIMIYAGLIEAFKQTFENPWVAIAIGIAAIAAGQVLVNLANKGPEPTKMATGGIVPGGFPNDTYPALLTSGEMVLPKPIALSNSGFNQGGGGGVLTTRISGKDLLVVLDRATDDRNFVRGR